MQTGVRGRKIAFLAVDGVEQAELIEPWRALERAGAEPRLISLHAGEIESVHDAGPGERHRVDCTLVETGAGDFDALVIPGGAGSVARLRDDARAIAFVRTFLEVDEPVAALGEAPLLLVAADVVRGRTLTGSRDIAAEVRAAGGEYVEAAVQLDQRLLTGPWPGDLARFSTCMVSLFARSIDERRLDDFVEQTFPASDPLPGPMSIGGVERKEGGEARE